MHIGLRRSLALLSAWLLGLTYSALAWAADSMSLRLDYLPQGYHAPLFYGLERGFYKEQGIDLKLFDGKGSNPSLQSVAAGNDTVVLANLSAMLQSTAEGMPVVAIGGLVQKLPDSIIALKGSGIRTPKDMEGRSLSIPPASAVFRIFPAFANAANIDRTKVKLVQMASGATHTALLQGQVDMTTGWAITQGVSVNRHKPIEPPILFADYGITLLGAGFVVRQDTAATKKVLLKRFMAATAKAYDAGLKNTEAATGALIAERPQIDRSESLETLSLFPPYLHTDNSKGRPFGWTARQDWEKTLDIMRKYFEFTASVDLDKMYTNELVSAP
jgi:NitT/TauT family transport system substrate-binding protein